MKLIDTFLFFNELDLLEIRIRYLYPVVDFFIITEARLSFAGHKKRLYFEENKERFSKYKKKIIHQIIDTEPSNFKDFIKPDKRFTDYNKSYEHKHNGKKAIDIDIQYQREIYQRDYQILGVSKVANVNDYIILGDVDEIPNRDLLTKIKMQNLITKNEHVTLCLKWFMYYINSYLPKEWYGIRLCEYQYLEDKSIDLMRYHTENKSLQKFKIYDDAGWHFHLFGGVENVKEKLSGYNYSGTKIAFLLKILNYLFPNRIKNKIKNNKDILDKNRKIMKINPASEFPRDLLAIIAEYPKMFR